MIDEERGLYGKYFVRRTDGSSEPGGKHEHCEYFVLDLTHDPKAPAALAAYAQQCAEDYPLLYDDLNDLLAGTGYRHCYGPLRGKKFACPSPAVIDQGSGSWVCVEHAPSFVGVKLRTFGDQYAPGEEFTTDMLSKAGKASLERRLKKDNKP